MKSRKKCWGLDRTLRNTTINRFKGRTMAVFNSCYRTTGKEIREITERRIDTERGKFRNQNFVPDSIEGFRYVQRDSKRFTEMPKSGGPRVREKGKKITSRPFLTKAILVIRDKIRRIEMFPNLPVNDRFKNFRKYGGQRNGTVVERLRGIPLLRQMLNERTFPTRREV